MIHLLWRPCSGVVHLLWRPCQVWCTCCDGHARCGTTAMTAMPRCGTPAMTAMPSRVHFLFIDLLDFGLFAQGWQAPCQLDRCGADRACAWLEGAPSQDQVKIWHSWQWSGDHKSQVLTLQPWWQPNMCKGWADSFCLAVFYSEPKQQSCSRKLPPASTVKEAAPLGVRWQWSKSEHMHLLLTGLPGAPTGPIGPTGPGRPGGPYGQATEEGL